MISQMKGKDNQVDLFMKGLTISSIRQLKKRNSIAYTLSIRNNDQHYFEVLVRACIITVSK